jgi:hypothetical protein
MTKEHPEMAVYRRCVEATMTARMTLENASRNLETAIREEEAARLRWETTRTILKRMGD